MKFLQVQEVSKKYPQAHTGAVSNVSLEMERGELLALTGESGCGKTSLLRLISGLEEPDQGSVYLNGDRVTGPSRNLVPGHKDIRMVYQQYELSPNITAYANIAYALRAYNKDYQAARTHQLLEICRITHLKDKYPRELSGGEQQRVAFARALAEEPALLLLDEPFSNLDNLLRQELKAYIGEVLKDIGMTAIFVTHESSDALSMADRIAIMQQGEILQLGTPRQIYQQPRSLYVAQFFGRVNLLNSEFMAKYLGQNIKSDQLVMLRPEHLFIDKEKGQIKGRITKINYFGANQEVEVALDDTFKLLLFDQSEYLTIGGDVKLNLDLEKIYAFPIDNQLIS